MDGDLTSFRTGIEKRMHNILNGYKPVSTNRNKAKVIETLRSQQVEKTVPEKENEEITL